MLHSSDFLIFKFVDIKFLKCIAVTGNYAFKAGFFGNLEGFAIVTINIVSVMAITAKGDFSASFIYHFENVD